MITAATEGLQGLHGAACKFTACPEVGSYWSDRPIPARVVESLVYRWVAQAVVFQITELCRQMVAVIVLNSDAGCQSHRSPEGLLKRPS